MMMLEKHKQQIASNFAGANLVEGGIGREKFQEIESRIIERIGRDEAACLRRNGFSGVNIEQRAEHAGLSDLYHVVYQNFSRNVHTTDYAELLAARGSHVSNEWQSFEELRNEVALSTAITCSWQMATLLNGKFRCGCRSELEELWETSVSFDRWVTVPGAHKFVEERRKPGLRKAPNG
jgi:Family of unknown function (DUF5677)